VRSDICLRSTLQAVHAQLQNGTHVGIDMLAYSMMQAGKRTHRKVHQARYQKCGSLFGLNCFAHGRGSSGYLTLNHLHNTRTAKCPRPGIKNAAARLDSIVSHMAEKVAAI